jgi:calmodulin
MRYLGQFPSEAQVRDVILVEIEDDEPSELIKFSKFEPYMLQVIKDREFEPDDPETVLAAFKLLDPEGKGYVEIEDIREKLMKLGIEFNANETKDFIDFATNNDPNATVIYYEDYLSRVYTYVEKHLDSVMKGYSTFSAKK